MNSENAVDILNQQRGKYVTPSERRRLQQQPTSSPSLSASGSKFSTPNQSPSNSGSFSRLPGNLGQPKGTWSPNNSNTTSASNSPRLSGQSKWNDNRSAFGQYGADGLCPPNQRLESELFEGLQNTGLNFEKYKDITVESQGDSVPIPISSFDEIDLGAVLRNSIRLSNYTTPTPVQKHGIPIIMAGRDLMACAQTGSGKTNAFLFPMISEMCRHMVSDSRQQVASSGYRNSYKVFPTALILAPTRELAQQIHQEARKATYRSHIRCVVVYGGADSKSQIQELERGCHVLVATPGRLIDMIERGKVNVSAIKFLCIDEADRMLDMGFEHQIREIVGQTPIAGERQTLMFSATFPKTIQRLAEDFLYGYIFLKVGRIGSTTESITQRIKWIEDHEKKSALVDILPTVDGLTLVFCETKRMADNLEEFLYNNGFSTASIHGDRTQSEREAALNAFKEGRVNILVATDVAARGLDISNVRHVINFDLPHDIDDYVHRIGRTGRAGHDGFATAFFNDKNSNIASDLVTLLEEAGQDVESWLLEMGRRYSTRGGNYGKRGRGGRGAPQSRSNNVNYNYSSGGSYNNSDGGNYGSSKAWW
jgi:ATP-dependent RNA helicase DDX3X